MPNGAVVCLHAIEHMRDPHLLLKIMKRLLAPGGSVSTVDSSSPIHLVAERLKQIGLRAPYERIFSAHHLNHFTHKSLRRLVELEELRPVRQFNYNHPLKSVDVPPGHPAKVVAFKVAMLALFSTSRVMGKGILQSIIATAPM